MTDYQPSWPAIEAREEQEQHEPKREEQNQNGKTRYPEDQRGQRTAQSQAAGPEQVRPAAVRRQPTATGDPP